MERMVALLMVGAFAAFWVWWLITGRMRVGGKFGRTYVVTRAASPVNYWISMSLFAAGLVLIGVQFRQEQMQETMVAELQSRTEPTTELRLSRGPKGLTDLPPEIAAIRDSGVALHNAEQYAAAIAQFDQVIAFTGDDAQLFYLRGLAYWFLQRTDLALRDMQRSFALDSTSADTRKYLEQLTRAEAYRRSR